MREVARGRRAGVRRAKRRKAALREVARREGAKGPKSGIEGGDPALIVQFWVL